jgi:tripartite-type tricarboxylate transporter receptor subunit TctC
MSSPEEIQVLVRAFKAAWNHYFRAHRTGRLLEGQARPALAEFLVERLKDGISDVPTLAAAGLEFLFSMEDPLKIDDEVIRLSWNMRLEGAGACFVPVGHVRWLA